MNKIRALIILILGAAVLAQIAVYFLVEQHPEARILYDSREYLSAASNLFSQGVLYCGQLDGGIDPALFSKRPPAYPLLLGLILQSGGGVGMIVIVQVALTLLAAMLLYWVAGLFGLEQSWRLVPFAMLLFYPIQIIYSQVVMAEILFQLLLLTSFVLLTAAIQRGSLHLLGFSNLAIGLAALAKPVMVYFWIPNILYHGWLAWRLRSSKILVWAMLPLLIVCGWSYRNYLRTGYFHFSSIKTINMQFNLDGSSHPAALQLDGHSRVEDFGSWSREVERVFVKDRLSNWPRTLYRQVLGNLICLLDPGRFDIYQILGLSHETRFPDLLYSPSRSIGSILGEVSLGILFYLAAVFLLNLFVFVSFLYVMLKEEIRLEYKIYWFLLVAYVVLLTGPIGASRFRLEIEPLLLLAVPFFAKSLANPFARLSRKRQRSPHLFGPP